MFVFSYDDVFGDKGIFFGPPNEFTDDNFDIWFVLFAPVLFVFEWFDNSLLFFLI